MTDPLADSPTAVAVSADLCVGDVVALQMRDARGNCFARAAIPLVVWLQITSDLIDKSENIVPGNPGERLQ